MMKSPLTGLEQALLTLPTIITAIRSELRCICLVPCNSMRQLATSQCMSVPATLVRETFSRALRLWSFCSCIEISVSEMREPELWLVPCVSVNVIMND